MKGENKLKSSAQRIGSAFMALVIAMPLFSVPASAEVSTVQAIPNVTIDLGATKQVIRGFGGMNHPGWIADLTPEQRETAFGNGEDQLGFSVLRIPIEEKKENWGRSVDTARAAIEKGAIVFASPWNPPNEMLETFSLGMSSGNGSNYEAEAGSLVNAVIESEHSGYTGGGYVAFKEAADASLQFNTILIGSTGTKNIKIRYALESGTSNLDVYVNGVKTLTEVPFEATGSWTTWVEKSIQVPMVNGTSTLQLVTTGNGGPHVDKINVTAFVQDTTAKRLKHDMYADYAAYLNEFDAFMKENGVNLYAISVQNEPDYAHDWTWWSADEIVRFMKDYAGTINNRVMAPESFSYVKGMSDKLLNDPEALANMDILGAHTYGTQYSDFPYPLFEQKGAGKELWMTEVYYPNSSQDSADRFPEALDVAEHMYNAMVEGNFQAYVWWYIRRHYGPIKEDGTISKRGYMMAHYSKFIRPGYERVDATKNPEPQVFVSAYKGDNKAVVVAVNKNTSAVSQTFALQNGSASQVASWVTDGSRNLAVQAPIAAANSTFTAELPPQSVTTFVMDLATGNGGDDEEQIPPPFKGAANPYLPLWEHIPDGEPRLFEDPDQPGKYRVYIFGSHDTLGTTYCGYDLVTWSAPADDLTNWRYDGKIFESIVNGSPDILYAPEVVEVLEADGTKSYYLYPHSQASGRISMVAKAKRPDGPYEVINWKPGSNQTQTEGIMGFDPAVFVDDDGRVYGYWGFKRSYAAELDPSTMATLKPGTEIITDMIGHSDNVPEGNDFRFFEAASLRKVEDKYVLVYSRKTKDGEYGLGASNNTLAYAYADAPLGPWTYGGTIVDARGPVVGENGQMMASQPSGNTHGSILLADNQWYVFYHRSINNDGFSRQSMVAPIHVEVTEDGKVVITGLNEVRDVNGNVYTGAEVTSDGFQLQGLDPRSYYSAGIASFIRNSAYVKATYDTWEDDAPVVNNKNNSIIGFKYYNFDWLAGEGQSQLELHVTPKGVDGTLDIMLDSPWTAQGGQKIGSLAISSQAAQHKTKMVVPVPALDQVRGKHSIYVVFRSASSDVIADLNGLRFSKTQTLLLDESFNADLSKWTVQTGSPTVQQGLTLSGAAAVTSAAGEEWSAYEFASRVQLNQGAVGLRFLQSDANNYYELQLKDGALELYSVQYGTRTLLKSAANAFVPGETAQISITASDRITVRVNGVMALQQRASEHDAGRVGIVSYEEASATIAAVQVQPSNEDEVAASVNTVAVNGVPLSNFTVSPYDLSVRDYNYFVPAGTTAAPIVTAYSNDRDVTVSISQADSPLGTAIVRFAKEDKVKTYKVYFTTNEAVSFAGGLPEGWQVLNPSDAANPLGAITTSDQTVAIQAHQGDSEYPAGHNRLQLPISTASTKWTVTINLKTDKPLLGTSALATNTQAGLAIRDEASGDSFKLNAVNRGSSTNVNVAGRTGVAPFTNTSATTLPNPSNNESASYWLRLVKNGSALQGYYSIDNAATWRTIGTSVGFSDDFFENAKLELYTTNLSADTEFKATYSLELLMSDGESAAVARVQQAVEQAAKAVKAGATVAGTELDTPLLLASQAQEKLNSSAALQSNGVSSQVSYDNGQYALQLTKAGASLTIAPYTVVPQRTAQEAQQLQEQANGLSQETYTSAQWKRLTKAKESMEAAREQNDALAIAVAYIKLKAAINDMTSIYSLRISAGTGGTVTTGASGSYAAGTTISLQATPSSGYRFQNWTSSNGGSFSSASNATTTFTMPAGETVVTANFERSGSNNYYPTGPSGTTTAPTTPDTSAGSGNGSGAAVEVDASVIAKAHEQGKTAVIELPEAAGATLYTAKLPADAVTQQDGGKKIELTTKFGIVTVPGNLFKPEETAGAGHVALSMAQGDASLLDEAAQAGIGSRPLIVVKASVDDQSANWSNPDARVVIKIPYVPTTEELADPEHIVIWSINAAGQASPVPTGRYDAEAGAVVFTATQFGTYAVAYVEKSFEDIAAYPWATKAIEVMAAKGVINGISQDRFDPASDIKRGDFILMLVRALGLNASVDNSFADVSPDAYYAQAIAIAKKLGIANGVAPDKFAPEAKITRQDMMALIVRALDANQTALPAGTEQQLQTFADQAEVAEYALQAIATLIKNGIVSGSGDQLNPTSYATRAETAAMIYRMYSK